MKRPKDQRVPVARRLRRDVTDAEKKLWRALRVALPAVHWRKQATIGRFIVDFACHASRIVIELDGGQHALDAHAARDVAGDDALTQLGYRVLRFWNNDVMQNVDGVVAAIAAAVQQLPPTPDPSPPLRGGRGEARA